MSVRGGTGQEEGKDECEGQDGRRGGTGQEEGKDECEGRDRTGGGDRLWKALLIAKTDILLLRLSRGQKQP